MNKTKKSLLLSCLSMLMCVSMLVGSTFAWFTATDSAILNEIKSGTLTIELQQNGEAVETIAFVDQDENDLWEPGVTYTTDDVTIKNTGSLYLVYTLNITGVVGDAKLNEVIDWTFSGDAIGTGSGIVLAPGATKTFKISGHMQETAGNDYQNLSISGATITVNATQTPAEYDSTTKDYDADAITDTLNPWGLNLNSTGFISYDEATKTYTIVATGSTVDYVGGSLNFGEAYSEKSQFRWTYTKLDGTNVDETYQLKDEISTNFLQEQGGKWNYQLWINPGQIVTYYFDMDGDNTMTGENDFTVVFNAMSATKVTN